MHVFLKDILKLTAFQFFPINTPQPPNPEENPVSAISDSDRTAT